MRVEKGAQFYLFWSTNSLWNDPCWIKRKKTSESNGVFQKPRQRGKGYMHFDFWVVMWKSNWAYAGFIANCNKGVERLCGYNISHHCITTIIFHSEFYEAKKKCLAKYFIAIFDILQVNSKRLTTLFIDWYDYEFIPKGCQPWFLVKFSYNTWSHWDCRFWCSMHIRVMIYSFKRVNLKLQKERISRK